MKELFVRGISGAIYVILLIASLFAQEALVALLALFGIISLAELSKLIRLYSSSFIVVFGIYVFITRRWL